jgi:bifunctional non-homologous end joining protein LigD
VVIVGWKPGAGRRAGTLGSLLLAVHDDAGEPVFAGHVGTGFTDAALRRLGEDLARLERATPALPDVPRDHARHARWVEPVLVGEVVFRNWTPDGRLRHPVWRGLRPDREVTSARRAAAGGAPPVPGTVVGAMQTRDGRWRVEVVRRGRQHRYRLVHDGTVLDGLVIATVERVLREGGADIADLVDVPVPP